MDRLPLIALTFLLAMVAAIACAQDSEPIKAAPAIWPQIVGDAPLVAVAIWLSRELVRSHREGLEAVREAVAGLQSAVANNTQAISSLYRPQRED